MNSLSKFFQIPLIKFSVHIVLLAGLFVNIYNIYGNYQLSNKIIKEKTTLQVLTQQNLDSRNEKDYYSSEIYKEKYAKENNFKNRGEQVVDTSDLETSFNRNVSYTPTISKSEVNNLSKWWKCLFGNSDSAEKISSELNLCRN